MIDWNDFAREVHAVAVDKGWWDKPVSFDDVICMCICELAEAVEEYRNGRPNLYHLCVASGDKRNPCDWDLGKPCPLATGELACEHRDPKPEGIAVELADCVLRLLDYAVDVDIYIEEDPPIHGEGTSITSVVCTCGENLMEARRCFTEDDGELWAIPLYFGLCIGVIMEWARLNNVDMESILREKHAYNKTRPYRHGGKVL